MRAMLLSQIAPIHTSPLKCVDMPMPEPRAGEVRIRVRCCAICRTDLHVIEGDLPQHKLPVIPATRSSARSTPWPGSWPSPDRSTGGNRLAAKHLWDVPILSVRSRESL